MPMNLMVRASQANQDWLVQNRAVLKGQNCWVLEGRLDRYQQVCNEEIVLPA